MDLSYLILIILITRAVAFQATDDGVWSRDFGNVGHHGQFSVWRKIAQEEATKASEAKTSSLLTKLDFRHVRRTTTKLVEVPSRSALTTRPAFGVWTPSRLTFLVPLNMTMATAGGGPRIRKTGAGQAYQIERKDCSDVEMVSRKRVAKLLMELMRYLEGDNNRLVNSLREAAVSARVLVDSSRTTPISRPEDDLYRKVIQMSSDGYIAHDPDQVFPHLMTIAWLVASDQVTMHNWGWCPLNELNTFLLTTDFREISQRLAAADNFVAAVRYTAQEFIQSVSLDPYNGRRSPVQFPSSTSSRTSSEVPIQRAAARARDLDVDADELEMLDDYDDEEKANVGDSQLIANDGGLGKKTWLPALAASWFVCSLL